MVALHIKKSLEFEGYRVIASLKSGEEAVRFVEEEGVPDLVLMDIMLDGEMDGVEAAGKIREKFNLPIIYLTALTDKKTIERAKITEPFGYVMKPFNEKELHTTIEMALHKSAIENRLRESEEKFLSTVKSIGDSLVTINNDHEITFMNKEAESFSGLNFKNQNGNLFKDIFAFYTRKDGKIVKVDVLEILLTEEALPERLMLKNERTKKERFVGDFTISKISNNKKEVTGYVIIYRDVENKIVEEDLKQKLRVKNLTSLIQGQELERARVAREIHDGLGQMLTGMKLNLDFILSSKTNGNAKDDLGQLIDEAITEAKRISDDLMPLQLNELSLKECIDSLCRSIGEKAKMNIDFHSSIGSLSIEKNNKVNFYRIAQEALNNSVKYSKANNIHVQLNPKGNRLFLTIEDDGKGFDIGKALSRNNGRGRGILNMIDRTKIMNGRIEFDSNSDLGTLITVEIPHKIKSK